MEEEQKSSGITVDQFYNYILKYMTAEEALKKLLESSLLSYERLKFQDGEKVHPMLIIAMAAMDMDWQLAIETKGEEDDVRGMCVGTEEYINKLFPKEKEK